MVVTSIMET